MSTETVNPPELQTMRIDLDGDVGTLTLDRPEAFNAMNPEMIAELPLAFSWFADRAPLRALIVTGAGKAFCAGGDINWFAKGAGMEGLDLPSQVRRGAEVLHQGIIDLRRIPYPVIAAVNGPAAGAGFSLALACDIRVASESAFFACAYGRIGASPDGGMTYFLPRVLGPARATEMLLEDPNLSAEKALAMGLVTETAPEAELIDRARAKAAKLAKLSPHYARMAKHLVAVSTDNTLETHLQLERHGIADSSATEDFRGAVTAFLAGETVEFSGR
jgi:enoyl-CoA hydratase/carnithine racemase